MRSPHSSPACSLQAVRLPQDAHTDAAPNAVTVPVAARTTNHRHGTNSCTATAYPTACFFHSRSLQPVCCHQMSRYRLSCRRSSCCHPSCRWPSVRCLTYHWPCTAQTDNRLVVTDVVLPFTGVTAVGGQQGGAEEHGLIVRCAQQMLFFSWFQKA